MRLTSLTAKIIFGSFALSVLTACGTDLLDSMGKKKSATPTGEEGGEVLSLDEGSVEFDAAALADIAASGSSGSSTPSQPDILPVPDPGPKPAPGAKLVISYRLNCDYEYSEVVECGTNSPDTAVTNEASLSVEPSEPVEPPHSGFLPPPQCFSGSVTVDLRTEKVARITKIPAGYYHFDAILFDGNGTIIKRGSAYFEVLGGKVTRGKLVLYSVQHGNGNVIIDIIDGDKPVSSHNACIEFERQQQTVRPLLCEVGTFTCKYEKFSAKAPCDEFSARLSILKQLCEAKVPYDHKLLRCEHTK